MIGTLRTLPRRIRSRGHLLTSIGWPFLGRVAFAVSGLLIGILTARLLGPADRGIFTLAVLAGAFAALLPRAITYALAYQLAAVERRGGDASDVRDVIRDAWRFVNVASGLVLVVALPLAFWLPGDRDVALTTTAIVGASVIIGGPIGLTRGVALAQERMGRWAFAYTSYQIGALIGVIAAIVLAGGGLLAISIGWALGAVVAGLAGVSRADYGVLRRAVSGATLRPQTSFAIKDSLTGFLGTAAGRVDILLLGALSGSSSVGIYSVAVGASELISFLGSALQSSTYARIGTLEPEESRRLTRRVALYSMGLAAAQAVVLAAIAHPLVVFVFGEPFAQSADFLLILLVAVTLDTGRTAYSAYFLNGLGRPALPLLCSAIDLGVTAAVCLALIPALGGYGAAIAATAGYGIALAVSVVLMRRAAAAAPAR